MIVNIQHIFKTLPWIGLLTLSGCDSNSRSDKTPNTSPLSTKSKTQQTKSSQVTVNCPKPDTEVMGFGRDTNHNGILDEKEILHEKKETHPNCQKNKSKTIIDINMHDKQLTFTFSDGTRYTTSVYSTDKKALTKLSQKKPLSMANCQGYVQEVGLDFNHNQRLEHFEVLIRNQHFAQGTPITLKALKNKVRTGEDVTQVNTCAITSMRSLFLDQQNFNQDISRWNVASVTDMRHMFRGATHFNQNLNDWDVSNVTDMHGMFFEARAFNQKLSRWNTSKIKDMSDMFFDAYAFNQAIGTWDVSEVQNMSDMFYHASSFNQSIGDWFVDNVKNMADMFHYAQSFDQDIGAWDVSQVRDMRWMFADAIHFDHELSNWDVSQVTNMNRLFSRALTFDQDISYWDISHATQTNQMFYHDI